MFTPRKRKIPVMRNKEAPVKPVARQAMVGYNHATLPHIQEDVLGTVDDDTLSTLEVTQPAQLSSKEKWFKFAWLRRMPLKKKLLIFIPVGLVLIGGGVTAWALTRKKPAPVVVKAPEPVAEKIVEPPKPTNEASKLTGVQITPELNKRGITAIMIENSIDARPQSGLQMLELSSKLSPKAVLLAF